MKPLLTRIDIAGTQPHLFAVAGDCDIEMDVNVQKARSWLKLAALRIRLKASMIGRRLVGD